MSELSIGKKLKELAEACTAAEPSAPPLKGLTALLELGKLAEADPDAAGLALAGLLDAEAETLLQWADAERLEELAFLRRQLAAVPRPDPQEGTPAPNKVRRRNFLPNPRF